MAVEPIEDIIRLILESDGYFVRTNVRFKTGVKGTGYADLDLLAVKFDPGTGVVLDRIWGEVKAHLTSALTGGYIRGFPSDYATMLGEAAWANEAIGAKAGEGEIAKWQARQRAAVECAERYLGPGFRRVLYFGGVRPTDDGTAARELLVDGLEIVFVRDVIPEWIGRLSHMEGNEGYVRLITMLSAYGLLQVPPG